MDVGSRMSRFGNQFYRALNEEGLEHYVEQVDAMILVKWMVECLEPAAQRLSTIGTYEN